jgi:hypothetical protein
MLKPMLRLMQAGWEQRKVLKRDGHKGLDQTNWMLDKNVGDGLTFEWKIDAHMWGRKL